MSKFDREKLKVKDDGSIEGLEDQFKSVKEGYKDLFEQPLGGQTPNNTGGSASTGVINLEELAQKAKSSGRMEDKLAYVKAKKQQNGEQ